MEPIERLAMDLQTLKSRFDDLVTRFAVGEEREKRFDDKIDALGKLIDVKLSTVEKAMSNQSKTSIGLLVSVILIFIAAAAKVIFGGL